MRCPFCGHSETQVKDTRPGDNASHIRRRRLCPACGGRFTTFEYVQMHDLVVVKKNNVRVPFEREKLYRSIYLALSKRMPDAQKIDHLVTHIIRRLEALGQTEIPSSKIGDFVLDSLFALDKVAYVRYASVYKNFTKTEDFENFVRTLIEEKK